MPGTLADHQEACKTFLDQTKQLITLASAFLFAPAGFVALVKDTAALQQTDKIALFVVAEGVLILSVILGYVTIGTVAGTQNDGTYDVFRRATRCFSLGQFVSYVLGLLVFGVLALQFWFLGATGYPSTASGPGGQTAAPNTASLAVSAALSLPGPSNLGDLEAQLVAYHEFGGYDRDVRNVIEQAEAYVKQRAKSANKPAIVLDVDETALSNWTRITANNFAYFPAGPCDQLPKGPCGELAWEKSGQDTAIGPTLELFQAARALNVAVFFITGRDEVARKATEQNLNRVGFTGWVRLTMRPAGTATRSAADYKAPARKEIEDQGYTIIANVGDQPSDLQGGHSERAFLLPDPFYRIP